MSFKNVQFTKPFQNDTRDIIYTQDWQKQTYNEEAGTKHYSFDLHIEVQRELDAKVIGICKCLSHKTSPLFRNLANHIFFIKRFNLKQKKYSLKEF